jgi:BLOC-1 related complex subunit 5
VCSDTDVPFVSYTVNKPIGDSPKRKPPATRSATSRFSPRLGSSRVANKAESTRLARSAHNTLVTVNHLRLAEELRSDEELVRLAEIPTFFPVMQQQQQGTGNFVLD